MKKINYYLFAIWLSFSTGCALQPTLNNAEIASRYPEIEQLKSGLKNADEQGVDLFSADLFQQANKQYTESLAAARTANDAARKMAQKGMNLLDQAARSSNLTREELAKVVQARNRAITAGADKKGAIEFSEADQKLIELGNLVAKGRIAEVRETRLSLAKRYAKLEVGALQYTTAKQAQARIHEAERAKANDFAPQTYGQALSELQLANRVLESDADAQEKAASHAQNAYVLAGRAIQITEIIKDFKQSGMSDEQIVLWYQSQLANAVMPVVASPDFSQPNKTMIIGMAADIQLIVDKAQQSIQSLARSQQEYASQVASTNTESLRQEEMTERFRTVQNAFTSQEAEVYRKGNDVLIRAYGFNFPTGSSEIESSNFPLLKKITSAIAQFPKSKVQVSGHTDNRGSDQLNLDLSTDRAGKLAKFLVNLGNLSATDVNSVGYGESQPLAPNDTIEGRAANRRVEILIVNE